MLEILRMKRISIIFAFFFTAVPVLNAQSNASSIMLQAIQSQSDNDVFSPISKYMEAGDYEKLSAWFADNLELDILGAINNCTRNQAKIIMKNFFSNNTPKKFEVLHKSGRPPMTYAVGSLSAGGEKYRCIIYVKSEDGKNSIQQLRLEEE